MGAEDASSERTSRLRRALGLGVVLLVLCLAVFGGARRLDWPGGWAGVGLVFGGLVFQDIYVRRRNPGLLERRRRAGPGTPGWDRVLVAFSHVLTPVLFVICGVDGSVRHPTFPPPAAWLSGLLLWVVGQWIVAWAMGTNLFFEGTIRLQDDVGHRVISGGPYRFVRHPGYAGFLLYFAAIPLLFGSLLAWIPAALVLLWILPRTVAEDRFLQRNLPGYVDYARSVRWRLVPFVY